MRVEPIPQGLWLRLFEGQYPDLQAKRPGPRSSVRTRSSASVARQRATVAVVRERASEPLPQELWEAVFRVVPPGSLCALRAACRAWRGRLDDPGADGLWEAAYWREWCGAGSRSWPGDSTSWRSRFLARWWAHERWGMRLPTVCTLMGKRAHGGGTVTCVALSECGVDSGEGTALSASENGSLFLWRFSRAGPRTSTLAGSPHAVAQQHHRQCQGGDVRCPQRTKQFYGHAGPVWCLWYNPDQDLLLSGGYDATVKLWSLLGERCEATLRGHDGWVRSLEVMQAGRRVVSGGSDGLLKFWSLETQQCLHSSGPPNNDPRHSTHCLAAIEQQDALLSGHSGMRHLLRWDLATMQSSESFSGHDDDIYAIHAEGSSSLLVSGSKDRTVRVWDTRTPNRGCVMALRAHTGAVLDLKLRGNRIVSGSMDKTVRMWDIREPQAPLATLEGHSAEVHCVDFRDRMVLSGSRDTSLKVWTVV